MSADSIDSEFPCSMFVSQNPNHYGATITDPPPSILSIPLPTRRLASSALRALQVDAELSPLVQRSFSLADQETSTLPSVTQPDRSLEATEKEQGVNITGPEEAMKTILVTEYKATTNRMLRVAVNGFMESLSLVLGVMEELDVDVLSEGS